MSSAPQSATAAAIAAPARDTRGRGGAVITMVNLLEKRRERAEAIGKPPAQRSGLALSYERAVSRTSAYVRRPAGMRATTQASQQRSASSWMRPRAHHTTGCHQ